MSESIYDDLDAIVQKHRQKEAEQQKEEQTEARFKTLEEKFDQLGNLISERLPESPATPSDQGGAEKEKGQAQIEGNAPAPTPEPVQEELPIERIKKFDIPRIYTGDDEPTTVTYIDADDGETKTRNGRKKNHPTKYDVEIVETLEEQQPQEPEEQTA